MMKMGFEFPLVSITPEKVLDGPTPLWLNGWVEQNLDTREKINKVIELIHQIFEPMKQYFNLNFTIDAYT